MKKKQPFEVHVYFASVGARAIGMPNARRAVRFALTAFEDSDVYKVKVWDLSKGEPVPNLVNAPGCILELV